MAAIMLTTGSMLLMWIGEQVDEYGIGNGISMIIMVGILDRMPSAVREVLMQSTLGLDSAIKMFVLVAMFVGVIVGIIFVTEAQRRIPFQQAKHVRGTRVYGGQRHYLPLRVNQASIFPIIFAQSLLMLPSVVTGSVLQQYRASQWADNTFMHGFWQTLNDNLQHGQFMYTLLYVALIFFFSFFWTAITFNPKDMANNMKDYGTFIPGIRPGARTAEYLEKIMTRITIPGAVFLSLIAVMPDLVAAKMEVTGVVAGFYGGTSILIVVGVVLDLVRKIESQLLMRHYEGFMRAGARRR
jgi:preprotein translocase subunit SecY